MSKLVVFGHQNPDTDAITSAIAFAYLQNQLGQPAEAVALGEANEETLFALNSFQTEMVPVVNTVSDRSLQVALVDHNEAQQSATDIELVEIKYVVDHHRIANFQTANPLYYRCEPVGCTNTIIYKLFKEKGVTIPQNIAGLMLSAIISDTLLLKSPTCTQEDIEIATELAKIAQVDLYEYGLNMLKAGTNLTTKTDEELVNLDAKSFPMGENTLRIAQVNVVDANDLLVRRSSLEKTMQSANDESGYDTFILLITNILTSESTVLVVGDHLDKVALAFQTNYSDGLLVLPNVVSRKKQIVPPLTAIFTK